MIITLLVGSWSPNLGGAETVDPAESKGLKVHVHFAQFDERERLNDKKDIFKSLERLERMLQERYPNSKVLPKRLRLDSFRCDNISLNDSDADIIVGVRWIKRKYSFKRWRYIIIQLCVCMRDILELQNFSKVVDVQIEPKGLEDVVKNKLLSKLDRFLELRDLTQHVTNNQLPGHPLPEIFEWIKGKRSSSCQDLLSSYTKTRERELKRMIAFTKNRRSSLSYGYYFRVCALPALKERVQEVKRASGSGFSAHQRSKTPARWSDCLSSKDLKTLAEVREIFHTLGRLHRGDEDSRFYRGIKAYFARESQSSVSGSFFNEIARLRYVSHEDRYSRAIERLLKTIKRSVRAPERLCPKREITR